MMSPFDVMKWQIEFSYWAWQCAFDLWGAN
jgi:hypothetical protein